MQGNFGDNGGNDKPAGAVIMNTEIPADEEPSPVEHSIVTELPKQAPRRPGDNYSEPLSLSAFHQWLARLIEVNPIIIGEGEVSSFIMLLLGRLKTLEDATLPLAVQAQFMANAKMHLIADGRAKEPCGGTWINGTNNSKMRANEVLFFELIDAVGRKRTEDHSVEMFKQLNDQAQLRKERDAHLAKGGRMQ